LPTSSEPCNHTAFPAQSHARCLVVLRQQAPFSTNRSQTSDSDVEYPLSVHLSPWVLVRMHTPHLSWDAVQRAPAPTGLAQSGRPASPKTPKSCSTRQTVRGRHTTTSTRYRGRTNATLGTSPWSSGVMHASWINPRASLAARPREFQFSGDIVFVMSAVVLKMGSTELRGRAIDCPLNKKVTGRIGHWSRVVKNLA